MGGIVIWGVVAAKNGLGVNVPDTKSFMRTLSPLLNLGSSTALAIITACRL